MRYSAEREQAQRIKELERVAKTARQFTQEVLENVEYDFVVEAQNMLYILDEALGVEKLPVSPADCTHDNLEFVHYEAHYAEDEDDHDHNFAFTLRMCPDCGSFVVGFEHIEDYYSYQFHIKDREQLEIAELPVKFYEGLASQMGVSFDDAGLADRQKPVEGYRESWINLMREVSTLQDIVEGTDWRYAHDSQIEEEFDPWHAIRATRARLRERKEQRDDALIRALQAEKERDRCLEAVQTCWRFFDGLYGAGHREPIPYDSLPEDRQELADEALDAISRWMHDDEEELKTEQKRIAKLALEAIMTAGMHHKIWYLERIIESCGAPVDEWRERYEWEEGIAP